MKAYLLSNSSPLLPFRKSASQVRFNRCTVRSRLQEQLKRAGFDIIDVESLDFSTFETGSIVVSENMFISDNFLPRFLAAIPDRTKNYQCEVETSRYPLLVSSNSVETYRKLPLYYCGERLSGSDDITTLSSLKMAAPIIYQVSNGLPKRLYNLSDLRANFLEWFAIWIEYWFDVNTASSLYCREYAASQIMLAKPIVPAWLLERALNFRLLMERSSKIGKHCNIHPTAILEGCVIGDNVEIGPFAYLRSVVVGDNAIIRERSNIKASYIGEGAFIQGSEVTNCYIGAETVISTPLLLQMVFGERCFLSGGSGFADYIAGSGQITASIDGKDVPSGLWFLASCVGDDCFIGANLVFAPGRSIPDGTTCLDNGLIKNVPTQYDGAYVVAGTKLIQIPNGFIGGSKA